MKPTKSDAKCKKHYRVQDYRAVGGRRFSLLWELPGDGFPMYYPTGFTTHSLGSNAASTQRDALYAIKKVYEWAERNRINFELRVITKEFLSPTELDSLAQHFTINSRSKNGETISGEKQISGLIWAKKYTEWLFDHLTSDPNLRQNREGLEAFAKGLKVRHTRKSSSAAKKDKILEKKITDPAREELLKLFSFTPDENESFSQSIHFRNSLALHILYDTGMRLGELLSLKLDNFIPASGGDPSFLAIERNQDDSFDRRINQPVAKTLGRILAIKDQLEARILTYLKTYRAEIPNAGHKAHDFLFIVHRRGPNQGQEISISAFKEAIRELSKSNRKLRNLHPHILRHDWNYRHSIYCEKEGIGEVRERQIREEQMGWKAGSESAKIYDRRHIQELTYKVGIAISADTSQPHNEGE